MRADGSSARQITHCSGDCLKPAYLPRGEIVFTALSVRAGGNASSSSAAKGEVHPAADLVTDTATVSQLWVSKIDGSEAHPITFGPGDFQVEATLNNGMVLATARFPLLPSSGVAADRELYTVRSDGTGLGTLRCDHQHPGIRSQAEELDDGSVVFVKSSLDDRGVGGDLVWIRRGALHSAPLTIPPLRVASPQPISADELLVARETPTSSRTGTKLTLYAFDTATGKFLRSFDADPDLSAVEAVPVAAHEPPRWYWSTLDSALQKGYFVCLDSYRADGVLHGRIAAKLTRVRVLRLEAGTQRELNLGEAPVEEDGSFYIAVPPDEPVRFELLDGAGRVVRAQQSWIWSRSGEEHGCVGCHEDRALAPENRWPAALRRFDTPTLLGVADHPVSAH
jgi:hypothetical protein